MKKSSLFKNMVKSKGLHDPLIVIQAIECKKCGYDFCTCPMTEAELKDVAPKYSY